MKVAQVENDKIVIKEVEDIKLDGRKGAIVKLLGCGLCGSDIVKFREKIVHNGAVLGHEIVAVIDEINSDTNFKKGDRIVTSHHIPCGECVYCKHGNVSILNQQISVPVASAKRFLYQRNILKMWHTLSLII